MPHEPSGSRTNLRMKSMYLTEQKAVVWIVILPKLFPQAAHPFPDKSQAILASVDAMVSLRLVGGTREDLPLS